MALQKNFEKRKAVSKKTRQGSSHNTKLRKGQKKSRGQGS